MSFFLVLHEALHIDKSESADFKYDNSFGKLLTKGKFGPNFKDFQFCTKLCILENSRLLQM